MPVDRDRHRARLLRFTREALAQLPWVELLQLVGSPEVPGQAWWEGYYLPLLAEAEDLAAGGDPARCAELADIRREAGDAATACERMRSVFLLMRAAE